MTIKLFIKEDKELEEIGNQLLQDYSTVLHLVGGLKSHPEWLPAPSDKLDFPKQCNPFDTFRYSKTIKEGFLVTHSEIQDAVVSDISFSVSIEDSFDVNRLFLFMSEKYQSDKYHNELNALVNLFAGTWVVEDAQISDVFYHLRRYDFINNAAKEIKFLNEMGEEISYEEVIKR